MKTVRAGVGLASSVRDLPPYHAAGWRVARCDGGATRDEALALLGRALDFPSWYGRNLDALWDCVTDLTSPTVLVWRGWEQLAVTDPAGWAAIVGVLRQRAALEPAFAVWFVAGGAQA